MGFASEDGMNIITLRCRYNRNTAEWIIRVRLNNIPQPDAAYFTDDRKDAEDTQRLMAQQYQAKGYQVEIC